MVNGPHLNSAFLTSDHSNRYTILPNIHPFLHTFTHRRHVNARQQPARREQLGLGVAQGHLNTELGGAGDRTSNLPVISPPTLPPEPHAAPVICSTTSVCIDVQIKAFLPNSIIDEKGKEGTYVEL